MADSYALLRRHALGDVLREHRRSRPCLQAVVDGLIRFKYAELDLRVNQLVHALRAKGIGIGGRLLWVGHNSFRLLELLLAAAKLGAVLCPANWRMSVAETERVVANFDPHVVFFQQSQANLDGWPPSQEGQGNRTWIKINAGERVGLEYDEYESFIADHPDCDDGIAIDPELPVLAIYTAAFDGHAKAALLSHSSVLYQGLLSAYGFSIHESTVYLNSGPLFHLGTLNTTLAVFLFGGCNVFVPRVDAEEMLSSIEKERVTHAFIPRPTLEQIRQVNADGRYDVSSLWPTPQSLEWRHAQVMPCDAPFTQRLGIYGQTETSGWIAMGWLGGQGSRPGPLTQVRIVDAQGADVPMGEVGEIVVRGPLVMNGYYADDAENFKRSFDGWHHTRDLGRRLDDGSITFVGPKTVLIKSALENIYPVEVEQCLREHPAVAEVCVIGTPDPVWTQNVRAVVVLKESHKVSEEALIEHCRQRIASYKKPKSVIFVDSLPHAGIHVDREAVDREYGGGGYPFSKTDGDPTITAHQKR